MLVSPLECIMSAFEFHRLTAISTSDKELHHCGSQRFLFGSSTVRFQQQVVVRPDGLLSGNCPTTGASAAEI
jgi:hypothetical protein